MINFRVSLILSFKFALCDLQMACSNLPAMVNVGVNVALGVDGSGSGVDSQDILEVTKFASLIHNPSTAEYRDWPSPKQVSVAAT